MKWSFDAEELIKKVPFFVRKRVRARVEKEAKEAGKSTVTTADVKASQKRYLSGMQKDVRGYQIDSCFGPQGCPNRANPADNLMSQIERILQDADLLTFLKNSVKGDLKFHHEFRVTVADCPNACSQPQIKDIGIIGAAVPAIGQAECTQCESCIDVCKENAITFEGDEQVPHIEPKKCLSCGQCIAVCPSDTIQSACRGYRVQLAGKLGRHPQLAKELPGIYDDEEVIRIVQDCLAVYKKRSKNGQRFAEIFNEEDFKQLSQRYVSDNLLNICKNPY
jgi:dissimilatory sulfite reductase (desulfoviridin) alpha/beta subunit